MSRVRQKCNHDTHITTTQAMARAPDRQPMDRLLLWLTFLLLGIGIVSVYDASYAIAVEKLHGDSFHFVKMQVMWAIGGAVRAVGGRRGCRTGSGKAWP